MTPKTVLLTVCVLAFGASFSLARPPDEGAARRMLWPRVFQLSSFDSELAGRFSMDGTVDTGAVVLEWQDGLSGEVLKASRADLGAGPRLNVRWHRRQTDLELDGFCLAGTVSSGADRRLIVAQQVEVTNSGETEQKMQLVARLSPGSADPDWRPLPSLAFQPGEVWALAEDCVIVRDGQAVAAWLGDAPEVEILAGPASADDGAARLVWNLTVPAGESHWVEVLLAGPPAGGASDEQSWRARFLRKSYGSLEDARRWEVMYHGQFASFTCADDRFQAAMVTGIHILRSLGNAHHQVTWLSDRPFGHPASDAAAEAQILGTFFEYGLSQISEEYLDTLLDGVYERAGPLPLERKLAYLHGLARAVRLGGDGERAVALAGAISKLINGGGPEGWAEPWGDEEVAVAPWFDPDQVLAELSQVLELGGVQDAPQLPRLAWASGLEPGSAASEMLATRRALSSGDVELAWDNLGMLLSRTTHVGMGSMEPGGASDGRFALGITALLRAMLLNDHGPDLEILPGICNRMIELGVDVKTGWMPTAFGPLQSQAFTVGKHQVGGWLTLRAVRPPQRTVMNFPPGMVLGKVKIQQGSGTVEVLPPNQVLLDLSSGHPLRFVVTERGRSLGKQGG